MPPCSWHRQGAFLDCGQGMKPGELKRMLLFACIPQCLWHSCRVFENRPISSKIRQRGRQQWSARHSRRASHYSCPVVPSFIPWVFGANAGRQPRRIVGRARQISGRSDTESARELFAGLHAEWRSGPEQGGEGRPANCGPGVFARVALSVRWQSAGGAFRSREVSTPSWAWIAMSDDSFGVDRGAVLASVEVAGKTPFEVRFCTRAWREFR